MFEIPSVSGAYVLYLAVKARHGTAGLDMHGTKLSKSIPDGWHELPASCKRLSQLCILARSEAATQCFLW